MYRRVGVRVLSRKLLDTRAYRFTLSRQSKNSLLSPSTPSKKSVAFAFSSPLPNHLILPLPRLSLTPSPPLSSPPDKKQLNRSKILLPSFLSFHQIVRSYYYMGVVISRHRNRFFLSSSRSSKSKFPRLPRAMATHQPYIYIYIYIRICFYRFRVRGRCISEFACVICVCVCVFSCTMQAPIIFTTWRVCVCVLCVYMCDRGPALRTNIASCILSSLFLFFHFFFLRKWQLSVTANGYINNHYTLRFNTIITILVNLRRRFYYSLR